jgi:predicted peptidase
VSALLKLAFASAIILTGVAVAHAKEIKTGFLNRIHVDPDGKEAKYIVFVPHAYDGSKPFPLILFLHGMGESGKDGQKQVTVGLGPAIERQEKTFPFIVIFPQSQTKNWQSGFRDSQRALDILAEIQRELRVDPKRIFLTGISMGGYGTWSLAARYPDRWAAIVPICGGGNTAKAKLIKDISCWCFHGGADDKVPVERSREMIAALGEAGGTPIYTEYPGIAHNSWDQAYATPELYEWLLQQHLK